MLLHFIQHFLPFPPFAVLALLDAEVRLEFPLPTFFNSFDEIKLAEMY